MRENPKPFEVYRHFKGNLYQILTLAKDAEDGSEQVVYQALYGSFQVYVRPLAMFMSETDHEKYPNCGQKYRFEKMEEKEADNVQSVIGDAYTEEKAEDEMQSVVCDTSVLEKSEEETQQYEEELTLDPTVLAFLDAGTNEERINLLASLHHRITDEMINTMAVSVDVEIEQGPLEERYQALKNCLLTKQKFEKQRIR